MPPALLSPSVPPPMPPAVAPERVAVSVIIPAYNIVRYLEACVRSVLAQTWRDFELILVDDGSTDGTAALCDRLALEAGADGPAVRVVHRPNGGPGAARNAGLDAARGVEAIAFIDGDDVVHCRYLEVLVGTMQRTGAHIVQAPFVLLGAADRPQYGPARLARPLPDDVPAHRAPAQQALSDMLYQRPGRFDSSPCKLFSRTAVEGLRFDTQYHAYEDLLALADLLVRHSDLVTVTVAAPIYFYFKQADGTLNARSVVRTDAFDVCDALDALMRERRPDLLPAVRSRRLSVAFNILRLLAPSSPSGPMARRCWQTVCSLRGACLRDARVRAKSKAGILLSYAGRRVTLACFRLVQAAIG